MIMEKAFESMYDFRKSAFKRATNVCEKKTMPLIRTYMHSSMKSLLRGLLVYAFSQIAFEKVDA